MAEIIDSVVGSPVIDFACELQTSLSTFTPGQPILSPELTARLENELGRNPFVTLTTPGLSLRRVDAVGTSLWNTCSQLIVSRASCKADIEILAKARAFAFALLNIAVPPSLLGGLRSLAMSLIAAQTCIVAQQLDLADSILVVSGARYHTIQPAHLGLDVHLNYTLTIRYLMLKARMAVAQRRFRDAEQLWLQIIPPFLSKDRKIVVENCYLIGESVISVNPAASITWLQRAHEAMQDLGPETLPAFQDWDLVVKHSLAVACFQNATVDSTSIFSATMDNLRSLYPDHPAVVLLGLTLMNSQTNFDEVVEGFRNVVKPMRLTNGNMPTIFTFVHLLTVYCLTPKAPMEALYTLLLRYLPREWTEKCFVNYLVFMVASKEWDSTNIQSLKEVMRALEHRGYPSFSAKTSQVATLSLSRLTGNALMRSDLVSAIAWLEFCNSEKIFYSCKFETQYLIHRKLTACYLKRGALISSRNVLDRGLFQDQNDCKRMYLEFKLSMLEGKDLDNFFGFGFTQKPILHKQASLLSCAIEAQRQRKAPELLNCLIQLVNCSISDDVYHVDFSPAEHHMFLICLVLNELENYLSPEFYECIGGIVTSALGYATERNPSKDDIYGVSATQLQWLYTATYRVGLKLVHHQQHELTLKVLKCSHEFVLLYRRLVDIERISRAPRPHMFLVTYLRIITHADAARRASDVKVKMGHYQNVIMCSKLMDELYGWDDAEEKPNVFSVSAEERNYEIGLYLNFEATMHLGAWGKAIQICEDSEQLPSSRYFLKMIDIIFRLTTPPIVAALLLKRIIAKMMTEIKRNIGRASMWRMRMPRYLRCLFTLATGPVQASSREITGAPAPAKGPVAIMLYAKLAEEVLEQIYTLAEAEENKEIDEDTENERTVDNGAEKYTIGGRNPFPPAELTQIALVTFEKAVEYHRQAQNEECDRWAKKAITIAGLVPGSEGEAVVVGLLERLNILVSE